MNLPENYLKEIKLLLGEDDYKLYLSSFAQKSRIGIRVNTSKISVDDFLKIFPQKLNKIPFIDNGFFVDDTDDVSKHPYYFAGLYYIQEPSAMVPASVLEVFPKDKVLDLCASPGGKATEISSKKPSFLLANDISFSRTIPLVKNLELFGTNNYCVTAEKPENLSAKFPEYFDKIIVDAPCSGEGMFRKDSSLISSWIEKGPEEYSPIQIDILREAVKMLKEGGELVYSTCTFSICEDEEIIGTILQENPNITIEKLEHKSGFRTGFTCSKFPDIDFSNCIRLFPHMIEGEGHFVAKIKKNHKETDLSLEDNLSFGDKNSHDHEACESINKNCKNIKKKNDKDKLNSSFKLLNRNKLPEKVNEFLSCFNENVLSEYYFISDNLIFMLSEEEASSLRKGIRYSRTGSLIGKVKPNGHFDVYSGFALKFKEEDFRNTINLPAKDINITKYLKGETLSDLNSIPNPQKGYVMLCVDHFPLGFLKYDGIKYKNLYEPGWRLNV